MAVSVIAERFLNSLHYKKSPVGNRHHGRWPRMPCSLGKVWELHKPGCAVLCSRRPPHGGSRGAPQQLRGVNSSQTSSLSPASRARGESADSVGQRAAYAARPSGSGGCRATSARRSRRTKAWASRSTAAALWRRPRRRCGPQADGHLPKAEEHGADGLRCPARARARATPP